MADLQAKGAERTRTAVSCQWPLLQGKDRSFPQFAVPEHGAGKDRQPTKHWRELRVRLLEERDYTCERCGKRTFYSLELHHLTYERAGGELDSDVVVLCRKCHVDLHWQWTERAAAAEARYPFHPREVAA
jgi:hypothetical protein